jgi:hypothetical protein
MVIPFLVPFIVRDNGFTAVQTARMLSSFAPGTYMSMYVRLTVCQGTLTLRTMELVG